MTATRDKPEAVGRRLDPASQRAVSACARRVCIPVSLAMWPILTGAWTAAEAMGIVAVWLSAIAVVSAAVAHWRRERFAAGSLNHWDESLACLALAHLARAFHG